MSKIGLIARREYLRRVSKKSFLLLTFLTPFLFAALVFVPLWLSTFKDGETRTVAIMDTTGRYAPLFEDTDAYRFIRGEADLDAYREADDKSIFAFLSITGDLLDNPRAATLYSRKQIPADLSRLVSDILRERMESDKLASYHIPRLAEIIEESRVDFRIQTVKWDDNGGESRSSALVAGITGGLFTMLIYMFILIYGAMVMQGVMEEKTNRIVEIMISSVRPFDLMMGKIVGIGLVGLTQVFIWAVMTGCLVAGGSLLLGGGTAAATLPANPAAASGLEALAGGQGIEGLLGGVNVGSLLALFLLYFVGGYLLYSSLFAAIGASVDNQEDTQQFMLPITLLLVFALYAGIYSMENPDGPLAFWCSLVPFTAPIVMMTRLPFDVPLWQTLLSLALLYLSAVALTWLSGKIYRVGILMYGKKPSLKELWRWVRYR